MMQPEITAAPAGDGNTIADIAQRDLDAALQLLADRAQYITGANGAAIALRRHGKKDMLCRASTGSNVPELGALLSTEFGLSGESVRTRQPMRCDDAARDARVNHDVCREMGIASVVVMPVVNDDEVLGVFELFSGKVNAFGERDVSALQRLSGLVETAVRLARASEEVLAGMKAVGAPVPGPSPETSAATAGHGELEAHGDFSQISVEVAPTAPEAPELTAAVETAAQPPGAVAEPLDSGSGQARATQEARAAAPDTETKKPLFWSAALDASANAHAADTDQSQVPPVLRNLRQCQACGFPVSSDRSLCVECEEKKWRGQLRTPKPVAAHAAAPHPGANTAAAAAPAKTEVPPQTPTEPKSANPPTQKKSDGAAAVTLSDVVATHRPASDNVPTERVSPDASPILTLGLGPSESWFSSNKYILGAVLVVAAVVVAIVFLR